MVGEGRGTERQARVIKGLCLCLIIVAAFLGAFLFLTLRDFRAFKAKVPALVEMEKENERYARHVVHLTDRLDRFTEKMEGLKELNSKLIELEDENYQYRKQLILLADRVEQVTTKMGELRELDGKLMDMLRLDAEENWLNVGGFDSSAPSIMDPKDLESSEEELISLMDKSLDRLDSEVALGERDRNELHKFLENQRLLFSLTPSILPTRGWLSSRFGYRTSPFTDRTEFHKGIDISARRGSPIVAPADGRVIFKGWQRGHGNVLVLDHGFGVQTKYAHLKKALAKKGQSVKRGQKIALVGNTGRSTGAHLHYEVHVNKVPVNPLRYVLD